MAQALETVHAGALDDHLPALSLHWGRSPLRATIAGEAVHYATRAGDQALAQLAHDEAAAYYGGALDQLSRLRSADDGTRLELLLARGDAQRRAADPACRATLLEASALAKSRGDADALARAALANTRGPFWSAGGTFDQERVSALEAALAAAGQIETPVRARLLATLGMELMWTADRAGRVRLSDESLRIARALGDQGTLAHVLMTRMWTVNAPDTVTERLAGTNELLALTDDGGDPVIRFVAHFLRARVTLESGDVADGIEHVRRAEALSYELGQPTLRWMGAWVRVGHVLLSDGIDKADRAAEDAYEIGRSSGQPDARLIFVLQKSVIRFAQGRLGELERELSELRAQLPAIPGLTILLAAAHCQLGEQDAARRYFSTVSARSFALPVDPLWLGFLTVAAEVACQLDEQASAAALYDLLRPHPDVLAVLAGVSTGCGAHYLGVLAACLSRRSDAEQHFARAAELHQQFGSPALLHRTRDARARLAP